jgi:hypothetical protein
VAFTTDDFTHSNSALLETVEAFSYIALYVKLIPFSPDLFANLIQLLLVVQRRS